MTSIEDIIRIAVKAHDGVKGWRECLHVCGWKGGFSIK